MRPPAMLLAALLLPAACAGESEDAPVTLEKGATTMQLTSSAFAHQGAIPVKHTCDGKGENKDLSPQLAWSGAPAETRSFALIVDDPDAPDPTAPKTTWVHWVGRSTKKALEEAMQGHVLAHGELIGTYERK